MSTKPDLNIQSQQKTHESQETSLDRILTCFKSNKCNKEQSCETTSFIICNIISPPYLANINKNLNPNKIM